MATQIIYNGVDITQDITVTSCIITDSNGGKQDYCKIAFANGGKLWQEWKPKYNDEVEVIHKHTNSGVMYVNGIESDNKNYALVLLSTPTTTKKKKTRVWRKVKLSEIINDVSKNTGFKVQFYGFNDYAYNSVSQINKTDIAFMCDMCMREGYRVKIYNKSIIVFNEKMLYSEKASENIIPEDCSFYSFEGQNIPLSTLTINHYDVARGENISYTATMKGVDGGAETLNICVDNQGQAERYANNILQHNNNFVRCGTLKLKNADVFASGSVINLSEFDVENDGKWYINESVFDTVNNDCIFKINKMWG